MATRNPVVATIWLALACAITASAHPVPFSYLDLRLGADGMDATVTAHAVDLAHELQQISPDALMQPGTLDQWRGALEQIILGRVHLDAGSSELRFQRLEMEILADRQAIRFHWKSPWQHSPPTVRVRCLLFPYDPLHQTFVNIYENGRLAQQEILGKDHYELTYYSGTPRGNLALLEKFVPAGIRHILIGPDHILFLLGLLLLGGGTLRLLKIVTAFTIAHSLTLSLAATGVFNPPARIIEPAIALSIVYIGVDNLMVGKTGRDVRAWIAFVFGFVHGFGFAGVLREFGLPSHALAWSLFSFNAGVEIGQAIIVVTLTAALALIARRDQRLAERLIPAGSICTVMAGAYWFIQRVWFS